MGEKAGVRVYIGWYTEEKGVGFLSELQSSSLCARNFWIRTTPGFSVHHEWGSVIKCLGSVNGLGAKRSVLKVSSW